MKNKGFTLIELLGVIIVLGILATIVSVKVIKVLNDSETKLTEIQIEKLIDAAKNYYIYEGMEDIDFNQDNFSHCVNVSYLIKNGYIDQNEISNFETGEDMLGSIKIHYDNKKYKYTYIEDSCKICSLVSDVQPTGISVGDKYQCKVKDDMEKDFEDGYYFYVLGENNDGTVNLIMDQNINSDGTPAGMIGTAKNGENVYNLVAWDNESSQSTNAYGPVTAMQFLYNATKDWTKVNPINYTYNDREYQGIAVDNTEIGYTSFVSTNGVASITPLDTTKDPVIIGTSDVPLRARMPIYASDASITEVTSKSNASYLYDNLDPNGEEAPYGYWTLSSSADMSDRAWRVRYSGIVNIINVDNGDYSGVRPVITLPKNRFENSNW